MGDDSLEKRSGCGILSALFCAWPRKSTSCDSIKNNSNGGEQSTSPLSKRRRDGSTEPDTSSRKQVDRVIPRPGPNYQRVAPTQQQFQNHTQMRTTNSTQTQKAVTKNNNSNNNNPQGQNGQGRKVPYGSVGISGELETMINDHQRSKVAGKLLRASSGNVMLMSHLGNLRQGPTARAVSGTPNSINAPSNNVQKPKKIIEKGAGEGENPGSLCRALSIRMDPEELKILGNEDYKNGNFEEALALYEAAISIDPNKASYRSNKSAALTALGRLLEAIFECREAIRIEPHYQRAHNRLATLYLRLGEAEKAMYHHKLAGDEADPAILTKAKNLQIHLSKCTDAKKHRDFNTLLKETELAISAGADSAPQIFALRAETMLKLRRHGEADETLAKGPKFDVEDCTKFFGPIGNANILMIRAQVDTAAGRFDEALEAAQRAARLDRTNNEVNSVLQRTQAMTYSRSKGNDLFRAQKYAEACSAYGEGLDYDPYNSVLLCNRATCRHKIGQYEKAIEDCNIALNLRPSYRKARLRRADCYAKLEKWEACIQDYEVLIGETPDDVEIGQALKDAREQLNNTQR